MNKTLLPSGLGDLLPPYAQRESRLVQQLLQHFTHSGYDQVHPPLMEYEHTLLGDSSGDVKRQTFRVMDPLTQEMLALRADMTLQIARIADSMLSTHPAPLRLCYAGQTVRTTPDTLRGTRQFRQVGLELFGTDSLQADIEIMQTAIGAIQSLELGDITLDLHLPFLIEPLTESLSDDKKEPVLQAIARKDADYLRQEKLTSLSELIALAGPAEVAVAPLQKIDLSDNLPIDDLTSLVKTLSERFDNKITITIDPLESNGFGYYSGIAFSLFLKDQAMEVGRGGRYRTSGSTDACGFTLYSDDLLPHMTDENTRNTLLLAPDTSQADVQTLQQQGYRTCYAMTDDLKADAGRSGYNAIYHDNNIEEME